jgi:hypothetical protein
MTSPTIQPVQPPPMSAHAPPPRGSGMKRLLKILGAVVGGVVLLGAGIGIGASTKATPAAIIRTHTVIRTQTVKVPGPTITKTVTVKVPGPTITKTTGPPPPSATMPGDGTFVVGTASGDWAPGTWQTSGPSASGDGNCYWATLSDLSGSGNSIIANDNTAGPTTLQVGSSVAGVQVSGCSIWNKIG